MRSSSDTRGVPCWGVMWGLQRRLHGECQSGFYQVARIVAVVAAVVMVLSRHRSSQTRAVQKVGVEVKGR